MVIFQKSQTQGGRETFEDHGVRETKRRGGEGKGKIEDGKLQQDELKLNTPFSLYLPSFTPDENVEKIYRRRDEVKESMESRMRRGMKRKETQTCESEDREKEGGRHGRDESQEQLE